MSIAEFLVVFAGVLAIGNGNRCSNKSYIELYDPNDHSKFYCWPVPDCHSGQEPSVEPGSAHPKGTDVDCKPCHVGVSFSNKETNYRCRKCTTCGNKVVRSSCTIIRDRLCDTRCISTEFYLNATDDECYPCTECCGRNNANVESQCLSSKTVHIGSRIGEKGALHCKVLSSQQCDELPKDNATSIVDNGSVINDTSGLKKKCNGLENNDSSNNNSSSVLKEKRTCSWSWDTLHIFLTCGLVCMALIIVVQFWLCVKRERKLCSSRSESFLCNNCYLSSVGHRCRGDMVRLLHGTPFQEKLEVIPEELRINEIPYEVEERIKNLDTKKQQSKNWYDVGRKLAMSKDELDLIKRENDREDGSPTSLVLSKLSTRDNVISLKEFVIVLHDLERNDIANAIIKYYKQLPTTSDTNV